MEFTAGRHDAVSEEVPGLVEELALFEAVGLGDEDFVQDFGPGDHIHGHWPEVEFDNGAEFSEPSQELKGVPLEGYGMSDQGEPSRGGGYGRGRGHAGLTSSRASTAV